LLKYVQDRPIFSRPVNHSALVIGDATFFDRPKLGEGRFLRDATAIKPWRDGVENAESW
jgi:hypothetical protein